MSHSKKLLAASLRSIQTADHWGQWLPLKVLTVSKPIPSVWRGEGLRGRAGNRDSRFELTRTFARSQYSRSAVII